MATDTRSRTINVRDSFHDLTPKMQAVVDAIAKNPDAGHREIARIASDDLEDDSVSRSYVPEIIRKQGHLIEDRRETLANQRFEGEERTEGDPFAQFESLDDSAGVQTIDERPIKETADNDGAGESTERLQADLTRRDVEALLSGDVPDRLRRSLLARVVSEAFDE